MIPSYTIIILPYYLTPPPSLQAIRHPQILEEMQQIASSERGYKNYQARLKTINPPCVPFVGKQLLNCPSVIDFFPLLFLYIQCLQPAFCFVGMYLSKIVFIQEGLEYTIPGLPHNFINFKKRYSRLSIYGSHK